VTSSEMKSSAQSLTQTEYMGVWEGFLCVSTPRRVTYITLKYGVFQLLGVLTPQLASERKGPDPLSTGALAGIQ
jgi:hypothetical protein